MIKNGGGGRQNKTYVPNFGAVCLGRERERKREVLRERQTEKLLQVAVTETECKW